MTSQLQIDVVEADDCLVRWLDVVNEVDRWGFPTIEELRYVRAIQPARIDLLATIDRRAVGAAFVRTPLGDESESAIFGIWVLPHQRRQGIGAALYRELSAQTSTRRSLQVEAYEDEAAAFAFLADRHFVEVARHSEVERNVRDGELPPIAPPPGIRITTRRERPDLVEAMYQVALEAIADLPGEELDDVGSLEEWRAWDIDRPSCDPDLCLIALHQDEVVAYAILMRARSGIAAHGLTGVKRAFRGRGIAAALKRAQLHAAKAAGFDRVATENIETNAAIRHLNEKLGYRPVPGAIVFNGPVAPSSIGRH